MFIVFIGLGIISIIVGNKVVVQLVAAAARVAVDLDEIGSLTSVFAFKGDGVAETSSKDAHAVDVVIPESIDGGIRIV